jgi:hypothetical protein
VTAAPDGQVQFRPDLYDRDAPIVAALARPFRFAPVDPGRPSARTHPIALATSR